MKKDLISFLLKTSKPRNFNGIKIFDYNGNLIDEIKDIEFIKVNLQLNHDLFNGSVLNFFELLMQKDLIKNDFKFDLFTCDCGIAECAGYFEKVKVEEKNQIIQWHIPLESYKEMEQNLFSFDKQNYLEKIEDLYNDILKLERKNKFVINREELEQSIAQIFDGYKIFTLFPKNKNKNKNIFEELKDEAKYFYHFLNNKQIETFKEKVKEFQKDNSNTYYVFVENEEIYKELLKEFKEDLSIKKELEKRIAYENNTIKFIDLVENVFGDLAHKKIKFKLKINDEKFNFNEKLKSLWINSNQTSKNITIYDLLRILLPNQYNFYYNWLNVERNFNEDKEKILSYLKEIKRFLKNENNNSINALFLKNTYEENIDKYYFYKKLPVIHSLFFKNFLEEENLEDFKTLEVLDFFEKMDDIENYKSNKEKQTKTPLLEVFVEF